MERSGKGNGAATSGCRGKRHARGGIASFGARLGAAAVWACLSLCSCSGATDESKAPLPPAQSAGGVAAAARPFYFVHISDPHLGFLSAADKRFATFADQINRLQPDFIVLTGDLTYGLTDRHMAVIDSALRRLQVPVKLIPGNHDVRDHKSLKTYRDKYGPDYYLFTHNHCDFVFLDSMILDGETAYFAEKDDRFHKEVQDQWDWLEKTLAESRAAGRSHIFLLLHIPPFVNNQDEKGLFTCMNHDSRVRLLAYAGRPAAERPEAGGPEA